MNKGPRLNQAIAKAAVLFAIATLLVLALLHAASPEFDPSWRMVSEYANGDYNWLLSLMFLCWASSTCCLSYALKPHARSHAASAGIIILVVAGLGEAMAAVFDINHSLHSLAAFLGILGFPLAAMLIGIFMGKSGAWPQARRVIFWLSNLTWASVVLMATAMAVLFMTLSQAGIVMSANSQPLSELPPGIIAFNGWANRFLIAVYCVWVIIVGLQLRKSESVSII